MIVAEKTFQKLNLRQAILATLAYFDSLGNPYPLTLIEIKHNLFKYKANLLDIEKELNTLITEKKVREEKGFYFLFQEDDLAKSRLDRYSNYAINHSKLARKVAFFLSMIPFLRFIGICNNLAINNVNQNSDIDFLIITDKKYIWFVKGVAFIGLSVLRLRRHGDKSAKRVCLSFFISEDNLDLKPIAKYPYDIHLAYWSAQIIPVFDEGVYQKFQKNNSWVQELIPAYPKYFDRSAEIKKLNSSIVFLKKIDEFILRLGLGFIFNQLGKYIQLKRLERVKSITGKHYKEKDMVMNNQMLKYHPIDRRKLYRDEFEKRIEQLKII